MKEERARTSETSDTDPRDEQDPDYEAEWEQLDEKVILAQILAELSQIRMLLDDADAAQSDREDDATEMFRCTACVDTRVPADERARHAREQHKAPPGAEATLFERVE